MKNTEESVNEQKISMTAEQFESMMSRLLKEARKAPEPTEEELAKIEQDRQSRKEQAQLSLAVMENKRRERMACIHRRKDGTNASVYVPNGHFMICQMCQAVIRPGTAPAGDLGVDIYDTQLFNELFQLQSAVDFA